MTNYPSRNNLKEKEFILAYSTNGIGIEVGWAWRQGYGVAAHAVPAIRQKPTDKKWS